eukprot:6101764-Ditylum_brightwellii.AAC.1
MNVKQSGHATHNNFIHNLDWGTSVAMISGNCTSLDLQHNPNWFQATKGSNINNFWKAMWVEIITFMKMKAFEIVPRTSDMNVILVTWVNPQKEGIDFFDTFAPVISWHTVRILLIFTAILSLASAQVYCTAAFIQSAIDTLVHVHQPKGWQQLIEMVLPMFFKKGHVLKLNKCLYGLCQSPNNFFEFLKGKMINCSFMQSPCDSCLFISDK